MKSPAVFSIPQNHQAWVAFIDAHCRTRTGQLNNRRMNAAWWPETVRAALVQHTAWLGDDVSISERLYAVYHHLTAPVLCVTCRTARVAFQQFSTGYRQYCSSACLHASPTRVAKIQATTNARYGADRAEIVAAAQATNMARYGVTSTTQVLATRQKAQETKHRRYGDRTYNNPSKRRITNRTRYGEDWTTCVPAIKEKMRQGHLTRHHNKWLSQQHLSAEVIAALQDIDTLCARNAAGESVHAIASDLGVTYRAVYLKFLQHNRTPVFYAPSRVTRPHQALVDMLTPLTAVVVNDRTQIAPKELDIDCPRERVAIELHGVYWHSFDRLETPDEKQRHARKYALCEEQGIRLLQLWDGEWQHRRAICESIIRRALGQPSQTCGARATVVDTPSTDDALMFMEQHHLYGPAPHSVALGLREKTTGEWRMMMTFAPAKYGRLGGWELVRVATHTDWNISGGREKLWAHVPSAILREPIHTYSDNRVFTGASFETLGFQHTRTTPPSYLYVTPHGTVCSRWQFQKKLLAAKLSTYDASLTEAENMFANGYRRLWDAGHKYWIRRP